MPIVRKNNSPVLDDGSEQGQVLDSYGATVTMSEVEKWKRDGKLYFYNRGNTTTPVTYTNTAILYTRPSQVIRVPIGKTIIPIRLANYFEAAAGVINEGVWIACNNDVGAGTSSTVTTTRGNLRGDIASNVGGCLINITYTGDVTTTGTNPVEIDRHTQPYVAAIGSAVKDTWILDIATFSAMPILVGPASLILIVGGGTALTGYATTIYAEFNSADLGF